MNNCDYFIAVTAIYSALKNAGKHTASSFDDLDKCFIAVATFNDGFFNSIAFKYPHIDAFKPITSALVIVLHI